MLLLGIDMGTSSVKVSVVDSITRQSIATASYPETEATIDTVQPGWAEQSPSDWWEFVKHAMSKVHSQKKFIPGDIAAIGITYQMHGLVIVDKEKNVIRNSIIWCDSRSVDIGEKAFQKIGKEYCLSCLLNSPGNFTASKLAWVKENEPHLYEKIDKILLPGDFLSMKLTGEITTSISALSEGIFWDFKNDELSKPLFDYFGFDTSIIPRIQNVFADHGRLTAGAAAELSLPAGIPVTYKAGDQPNNALSLNVFEPGEVAATAGTSGVIYGVTDQLKYDPQSRVNSFAHVNYTKDKKRLGVLLCINGTGIMNRWIREITGETSYLQINERAAKIQPGSEGLIVVPFGNGAERMLNNQSPGAAFLQLDLNKHTKAHLLRATQEGIAFSFRYGLDILEENGLVPSVIRAGKANMFLSDVFIHSFVNCLNVPLELYETDGSRGAAIGAGIGIGEFTDPVEAFRDFKPAALIEPTEAKKFDLLYQNWLHVFQTFLKNNNDNN